MAKPSYLKPIVLGILFFLPVSFLLFLYPASHNYNTLDVVYENVEEITHLLDEEDKDIDLKDNISILVFLGDEPMKQATVALNVKELVYDKFMGFKRFQILAFYTGENPEQLKELKKQLITYDTLDYWHFVKASEEETKTLYNSLLSEQGLAEDNSSANIYIVDKELNQRGRLDDRTKPELERNDPVYGLYAYNALEVAELKNKLSEDIRILFTEYRQKRKGNFDTTKRRAEDLGVDEKN